MKNILIVEILTYIKKIGFDFEYNGKDNCIVYNFSSIDNLRSNNISWIKSVDDYDFNNLKNIEDALIVCNETNNTLPEKLNFIKCLNPKGVFFSILEYFFKQGSDFFGIKPTAIIESEMIGKDVSIGHKSYIGKDVKIGNGVIIMNNVSIEGAVSIEDNTIIHSGTVIGKSGFGYYKKADGKYNKVPHYGRVIIGKYVEIGANSCIDRGALSDTIIKNYVKISNKCHIAHNVFIGENTIITAGVVICGSTKIESDVYIAPGSTIRNQLNIGKNSFIGLGSVVVNNIESGVTVMGVPARVIK